MSVNKSPESIHISNLIKKTKEKGYDGILSTNISNIKFLSNYETTSFAFAVLSENPVVYTSSLDLENAKLNSIIEVKEFESVSKFVDDLSSEGLTNLAIEDSLSIGLYEKLSDKFQGKLNLTIDSLIEDERMVKSPEEILKIQEATKIAQKAFKAIDGNGLSRVDFFVEENTGKVILNTAVGAKTFLSRPSGELLPRIC